MTAVEGGLATLGPWHPRQEGSFVCKLRNTRSSALPVRMCLPVQAAAGAAAAADRVLQQQGLVGLGPLDMAAGGQQQQQPAGQGWPAMQGGLASNGPWQGFSGGTETGAVSGGGGTGGVAGLQAAALAAELAESDMELERVRNGVVLGAGWGTVWKCRRLGQRVVGRSTCVAGA